MVFQIEPDLWGHVEQFSASEDGTRVPAAVAATGLPALRGLPNTAAGFAQAIIRLRDRNARNVLVAYHLSDWGTGVDLHLNHPKNAVVDKLAADSATFYRSLGARFDLLFTDWTDADAGFKQKIQGDGGSSWWAPADFTREIRYLHGVVAATRTRVVVWQLPLGNTVMRAVNDTWGHYRDNRVQWLLDTGTRPHLQALVRAGVIGLLFGGGAAGTTCACDADRDGVTNPKPIAGNTRSSLSADDDGGFFRALARRYLVKPLSLPR